MTKILGNLQLASLSLQRGWDWGQFKVGWRETGKWEIGRVKGYNSFQSGYAGKETPEGWAEDTMKTFVVKVKKLKYLNVGCIEPIEKEKLKMKKEITGR